MGTDRRSDDFIDTTPLDVVDNSVRPSRAKTILAAGFLFTVGSLLIVLGVSMLGDDRDRALAMIITGSLAFLPGVYATTIVVGERLGWPGYSVMDLPSYDS